MTTTATQGNTGGGESGDGPARRGRFGLPVAVAMLLALPGCLIPEAQPDRTHYYVLNGRPAAEAPAPAASAWRVAIRPIAVPEFLRSRKIAVRVAENEVRYSEEARWAEPLEAGLTRALGDDLARRGTFQLTARGEPHEFEVAVRLRHCEGVLPAGGAQLAARVEIFATTPEPRLVAQREFVTQAAGWDGQDYGELAKKLSSAAAELADCVAALVAEAKRD